MKYLAKYNEEVKWFKKLTKKIKGPDKTDMFISEKFPGPIFEADGPLDPAKWSWNDLTIPRDMQMDIHDMSYELRDEGYTVSYQLWPPYEKGNKLYKDNKYPHINITKRGEKIYYGWIEDFCQRIVSYLDEKGYNAVIKYGKLNSNEYFDIKDSVS